MVGSTARKLLLTLMQTLLLARVTPWTSFGMKAKAKAIILMEGELQAHWRDLDTVCIQDWLRFYQLDCHTYLIDVQWGLKVLL